jgi:pimeloyl-ACP methyl ester carboxylesterase
VNTTTQRSTSALLAGLVLGLVFACGCWFPPPPEPSGNPEWLISLGDLTALTGEQLEAQHTDLVSEMLGDEVTATSTDPNYPKWLELLRDVAPYIVDCRPMTYWGRDANDVLTPMTGMLYLPRLGLFTWRPHPLPLLAYPHGTELKRSNVPSNNEGDEWIFGAAAALITGFAVAMPDLPGMGGADPNRYHPYCHAKSLAYSVVDMVRAVEEAFQRDLRYDYRWDSRLYIMGYSEGGYAAMATVKEIQTHAAEYPDLKITGSACMAGPYDLSGAMRRLIIDPNLHYAAPYFLPYIVYGYDAVYDGPFDPNIVMNPVLLPDITQWMNGSMTGSDVDVLIENRLGVAPGQVVPLTMMAPGWVNTEIADDVYQTSTVGKILIANDLWSGWAPNRPMLMRQSPDDDYVPFANSLKTYSEFVQEGAAQYITFWPIGKRGDNIGHVEGALIGIPSAILWLAYECPRN